MTMLCEAEARADAAIGKMLRTARRLGATARRAQRDLGCDNPMVIVGVAMRAVFGPPDTHVPPDMAQLLERLGTAD